MNTLETIRVGVSPEVYARLAVAHANVSAAGTIHEACKRNAAIEFYPNHASGAAPELLEALEAVLSAEPADCAYLLGETESERDAYAKARAAIAKAKGESK